MSEAVVVKLAGRIARWATLDAVDLARVSAHRWYARESGRNTYAYGKVDGRWVFMHRFILGVKDAEHIDHANGNGLDNRRRNLRLCSQTENHRNARRHADNRVGFKGVHKGRANGRGERYHAQIRAGAIRRHIGTFDTPEEAHSAYCAAARELHGEFARFK